MQRHPTAKWLWPQLPRLMELGLSLSRPCVFEWVVFARFRLGQGQIKLFRTHPKFHGASLPGTVNHSFELESSNFLCELLAALWTLEWPNVLVLIHEGYSDRMRSMRPCEPGANVGRGTLNALFQDRRIQLTTLGVSSRLNARYGPARASNAVPQPRLRAQVGLTACCAS